MTRLTPVKKHLTVFLMESVSPVSVQECLESCHKVGLNPNKSTIYREIAKHLESGDIVETIMEDGIRRYELAGRCHGHCVVCEKCGDIERVDLPDDLTLQEKRIEQSTKFQILRHQLTFYGRCRGCRN